MSHKTIAIILAGGKGSRLWPLTEKRSKPAVPIAGKFRLIDIPISNCLHSEIRKIYILTQFNSESLNSHVAQTYSLPTISNGFVQILAAQQTQKDSNWYQGTADAVRQHMATIWDHHAKDYVVLGGDHLYKMDYTEMLETHHRHKADITFGVVPVPPDQAFRFGIVKVNKEGRITDFIEKPQNPDSLPDLESPEEAFKQFDISPTNRLLGSMGIYVFSRDVMFEILKNRDDHDFGGGIFPNAALDGTYKTVAHYFNGYWEDIGTIPSFFDAMIELTQPKPRFDFYDAARPFFTHQRYLPGAIFRDTMTRDSVICEGSILKKAKISNSIIGIRSVIGENSRLDRVVMMGADAFSNGDSFEESHYKCTNVGIGQNCQIEDAIIDKNAHIGDNVKILRQNRRKDEFKSPQYVIKDGIVIIPKNACISSGTIIE